MIYVSIVVNTDLASSNSSQFAYLPTFLVAGICHDGYLWWRVNAVRKLDYPKLIIADALSSIEKGDLLMFIAYECHSVGKKNIYIYHLICTTADKVLNGRTRALIKSEWCAQQKVWLGISLLTSFMPHKKCDTRQISLSRWTYCSEVFGFVNGW